MESYVDAILVVRIQSLHMQALTRGVYEGMNQPMKAFLSQPPAFPPGSWVSGTGFLTEELTWLLPMERDWCLYV